MNKLIFQTRKDIRAIRRQRRDTVKEKVHQKKNGLHLNYKYRAGGRRTYFKANLLSTGSFKST